MRVLPRSHQENLLPHKDEYQKDNLLTRGQEIAVKVDETKTVAMPFQTGNNSVHNVRLAPASGPNRTKDRHIGLSFHYIPTSTKQMIGEWDSAALVRGKDQCRHFAHAPRPTRDLAPKTIAFYEQATSAVHDILFKDAEKVRSTL